MSSPLEQMFHNKTMLQAIEIQSVILFCQEKSRSFENRPIGKEKNKLDLKLF